MRHTIGITLAALCCVPALAQRVRIVNESPEPQPWRWCTVALPYARDLPAFGMLSPHGWLVVRDRHLGEHSTIVEILTDLPGSAEVVAAIVPLPDAPDVPHMLSPAVEAVGAAELLPSISVDGRAILAGRSEEIRGNAAVRVWRTRAAGAGYLATTWHYLGSLSDRVQVVCEIRWRDPASPEWTIPAQRVEWRFGPNVEVVSRWARRTGFNASGSTISFAPPGGRLGDAQMVTWRGELHCRHPACRGRGDLDAQETERSWCEWSEPRLAAARGGPVSGVCLDWHGRFGAFQCIPEVPSNGAAEAAAELAAWRASLARDGSLYDRRPFALEPYSGSAGSQGQVFAMTHGGQAVALGRPEHVERLLFGALAVGNRPQWFHSPDEWVDTWTHPDLSTWSCRPHQTGKDHLKETDTWGPPSSTPFPGGWTGIDDQHFDGVQPEALALTGDDQIEEWCVSLAHLCTTQARIRQGVMSTDRGTGRIAKYMAALARMLPGEHARAARYVAERRIVSSWAEWRRYNQNDDVPVAVTHVFRDPRAFGPMHPDAPAWNPPFQAIQALGMMAAADVLDGDPAEYARAMSRSMLRTFAAHATALIPNRGWRVPFVVHYRSATEPIPEPLRTWENWEWGDSASGSNWWAWTGGALRVLEAAALGDDDPLPADLRARVRVIASDPQLTRPRNWDEAGWWATTQGGTR